MSRYIRSADIRSHNQRAWDEEVRRGNPCTLPVDRSVIARARLGDWQITITGNTPVPAEWIGQVRGRRILCLAAGGGQQGPILSAAGATVLVVDLSRSQLARDREVAKREGLPLTVVCGDMRDLRFLVDSSLDMVVHPLSNHFVQDPSVVWSEAFRVLRPGGVLLSGFVNPVDYALDRAAYSEGVLRLRHRLPYSDLTSISECERLDLFGADAPLEFGHSLHDQIGGQLRTGFMLTHFIEDTRPGDLLSRITATHFATRALKPPLRQRRSGHRRKTARAVEAPKST